MLHTQDTNIMPHLHDDFVLTCLLAASSWDLIPTSASFDNN